MTSINDKFTTTSVTRKKWKEFLVLVGLLLLAAVLKFGYLLDYQQVEPLSDAPFGDSVVYLDEARRLFVEGEMGAFYKPPVYTVLLAIFDAGSKEGRENLLVLQVFMGLGTLALVYWMAKRRAGLSGGVLAFLLLLFYAPVIFYETKLLDITVALFLLTAAMAVLDALLMSNSRLLAVAAGVLLGLASLSRAANLVLVLVAFLFFLFKKNRKGHAWLLLCSATIMVLPATIYNMVGGGDFIVINYSEGHTFLVGNNPNCKGIYNLPPGYPDGVLNERIVERDKAQQRIGRMPTPAEQRNFSFREGLRFLSNNPNRIFGLIFDKLRFTLSSNEISDNYSLSRERERFGLLKFHSIPFLLILLLGLFGSVAREIRPKKPVLLPLMVTLALLLVFYVTSRYRLPLAPFLCISGGVGLVSLIRRPLARRHLIGLARILHGF